LLSRVGRWTAELILVFVGVYAAFWLNGYQQHQQDSRRRDQILASLEQQLKEGIESAKTEGVKQDTQVAAFRRALNAGEMPPIHAFGFASDYSPTDIATLLQLRKRFEKYPDALQAAADFFHDLERTQTELLKRIEAERRQR